MNRLYQETKTYNSVACNSSDKSSKWPAQHPCRCKSCFHHTHKDAFCEKLRNKSLGLALVSRTASVKGCLPTGASPVPSANNGGGDYKCKSFPLIWSFAPIKTVFDRHECRLKNVKRTR